MRLLISILVTIVNDSFVLTVITVVLALTVCLNFISLGIYDFDSKSKPKVDTHGPTPVVPSEES